MSGTRHTTTGGSNNGIMPMQPQTPMGWQCPRCGACFAPFMPVCSYCAPKGTQVATGTGGKS